MVNQLSIGDAQSLEEQPQDLVAPPDAATNTGIVYVLSNEAMPGYIKIGKTSGNSASDVQRRMKALDDTGVPRAFRCEYAAVVHDHTEVERRLHEAFAYFRVRPNREFFQGVEAFRINAILKLLAIDYVQPETDTQDDEGDHVVEKQPPKPRFTFKMVDIPVGALLQWVDDPEIQCRVVNDRTTVNYEDRNVAISPLTQELKGWQRMPSGTRYWLYGEETLEERRQRMDAEAAAEDD